jgi:hypothetical protein
VEDDGAASACVIGKSWQILTQEDETRACYYTAPVSGEEVRDGVCRCLAVVLDICVSLTAISDVDTVINRALRFSIALRLS